MKRKMALWFLLLVVVVSGVMPQLVLAEPAVRLVDGSGQEGRTGNFNGVGAFDPDAGPKDKPKPWYERAWDWTVDKAKEIGAGVKDGWDWTADNARSGWDWIADKAVSAGHWIADKATQGWDWLVTTWNSSPEWVRGLVKGIVVGLIIIAVAIVVILAFPAIVAALGVGALVFAGAVTLLSTGLYGYLAGDNFSWLKAAGIGVVSGFTALMLFKFAAIGGLVKGWQAIGGLKGYLKLGFQAVKVSLAVQTIIEWYFNRQLPSVGDYCANAALTMLLAPLGTLIPKGFIATQSAAWLRALGRTAGVQTLNQMWIWLNYQNPVSRWLRGRIQGLAGKQLQKAIFRFSKAFDTPLKAATFWLERLGKQSVAVWRSLVKYVWKTQDNGKSGATEGG